MPTAEESSRRRRRTDLGLQVGLLLVPLLGGLYLSVRSGPPADWIQGLGLIVALLAAVALLTLVGLSYQHRLLRRMAGEHDLALECMLPDRGRNSRFVLTADPGRVEVHELTRSGSVYRAWAASPPRIEPIFVDIVTRRLPGIRLGDDGVELVPSVPSALRWMRPGERDRLVTDLVRITSRTGADTRAEVMLLLSSEGVSG